MPGTLADQLASGYGFAGPAITLGAALEGPALHPEPKIRIPLAMMNRHGLIAGATGHRQDQDAAAAHRAALGAGRAGLRGRHQGRPLRPRDAGLSQRPDHPAGDGHRVALDAGRGPGRVREPDRAARACSSAPPIASFGPLLLAKVLGLNETQTSVLTLVFKYCDDQRLPLLDFADLRAVLQFLSGDEGKAAARRATAGCRRPRWACCSARWSSWRCRAPSSSSASRSSMSTISW